MPGDKQSLRASKKLTGLPSLAFLDADGTVLLKVPYAARDIAGLRRTLARAEEYVRLRAAGADDAPATAAFLLMQLEERQVVLQDAVQRRAALRTDDDAVLAAIDQHIVDLGISDQVRTAGQKGRHTLGPKFLAMLRDGPKPSAHVTRGFWYAILEWAERERDLAAFRRGLDGMRAALRISDPDATWVDGLLRRYETKLQDLERAKIR